MMLSVATLAVAMLAGCGDKEIKEIKTVKNGVLEIDKSRTVEQALSSNLDDLRWEKFVNKRNQSAVKASGIWKGDELSFQKEYSNRYGRWLGKFIVVKPGKKVDVYFVINLDGSFAFATGEISSDATDLGFTEVIDGAQAKITPEDLKTLKGGFLGVLYH